MSIDPHQSTDVGQQWDDAARPSESAPASPSNSSTSEQLAAAISKTLARVSHNQMSDFGDRSASGIMLDVARRFPEAETVSDLHILSELVCELGVLAFPAPVFRRSIARLSADIAQQLLSDPVASNHLNQAWQLARTNARLGGP